MKLNFTPTDIAGGQYNRSQKIVFSNPIDAKLNPENRSITFLLETVTNTADGNHVRVDNGFIATNVIEADREIEVPLIDLEGNVLGKLPLGQMTDMTLLYINSYMIHIASQQGRLAE